MVLPQPDDLEVEEVIYSTRGLEKLVRNHIGSDRSLQVLLDEAWDGWRVILDENTPNREERPGLRRL